MTERPKDLIELVDLELRRMRFHLNDGNLHGVLSCLVYLTRTVGAQIELEEPPPPPPEPGKET